MPAERHVLVRRCPPPRRRAGCGASRAATATCVNPWPPSQISSSWRRTLRWLRAKPPGRSDTASRSVMIQREEAGLEALRPAPPHRRAARHAAQPRPASSSRATVAAADVVHPHDRRRRGRAPTRPWRACPPRARRPGHVASSVVDPPMRHRPDERLARRAHEHRTPTRVGERREPGEQREVVRRPSCRSRCPGSATGRRRRRPRRARRRAARRGSRRPRPRRRRSAGSPASCAARPACA